MVVRKRVTSFNPPSPSHVRTPSFSSDFDEVLTRLGGASRRQSIGAGLRLGLLLIFGPRSLARVNSLMLGFRGQRLKANSQEPTAVLFQIMAILVPLKAGAILAIIVSSYSPGTRRSTVSCPAVRSAIPSLLPVRAGSTPCAAPTCVAGLPWE